MRLRTLSLLYGLLAFSCKPQAPQAETNAPALQSPPLAWEELPPSLYLVQASDELNLQTMLLQSNLRQCPFSPTPEGVDELLTGMVRASGLFTELPEAVVKAEAGQVEKAGLRLLGLQDAAQQALAPVMIPYVHPVVKAEQGFALERSLAYLANPHTFPVSMAIIDLLEQADPESYVKFAILSHFDPALVGGEATYRQLLKAQLESFAATSEKIFMMTESMLLVIDTKAHLIVGFEPYGNGEKLLQDSPSLKRTVTILQETLKANTSFDFAIKTSEFHQAGQGISRFACGLADCVIMAKRVMEADDPMKALEIKQADASSFSIISHPGTLLTRLTNSATNFAESLAYPVSIVLGSSNERVGLKDLYERYLHERLDTDNFARKMAAAAKDRWSDQFASFKLSAADTRRLADRYVDLYEKNLIAAHRAGTQSQKAILDQLRNNHYREDSGLSRRLGAASQVLAISAQVYNNVGDHIKFVRRSLEEGLMPTSVGKFSSRIKFQLEKQGQTWLLAALEARSHTLANIAEKVLQLKRYSVKPPGELVLIAGSKALSVSQGMTQKDVSIKGAILDTQIKQRQSGADNFPLQQRQWTADLRSQLEALAKHQSVEPRAASDVGATLSRSLPIAPQADEASSCLEQVIGDYLSQLLELQDEVVKNNYYTEAIIQEIGRSGPPN